MSPRKPFECTSDAAADIMLLVDGSWSIGRTNFRRVRDFLEGLMTPFHIGPNHIQIGEGGEDIPLPSCGLYSWRHSTTKWASCVFCPIHVVIHTAYYRDTDCLKGITLCMMCPFFVFIFSTICLVTHAHTHIYQS